MVWLCVGLFLFTLGINLLVEGAQTEQFIQSAHPLLDTLGPLMGGLENAATLLMAGALLVGYFKGRVVLGKTAKKAVARLRMLPSPVKISQIYTPRYYLLLGFMMLLGMSIKFFGVPNDIRGFVDVAVGAALINGAMIYFRQAFVPETAV